MSNYFYGARWHHILGDKKIALSNNDVVLSNIKQHENKYSKFINKTETNTDRINKEEKIYSEYGVFDLENKDRYKEIIEQRKKSEKDFDKEKYVKSLLDYSKKHGIQELAELTLFCCPLHTWEAIPLFTTYASYVYSRYIPYKQVFSTVNSKKCKKIFYVTTNFKNSVPYGIKRRVDKERFTFSEAKKRKLIKIGMDLGIFICIDNKYFHNYTDNPDLNKFNRARIYVVNGEKYKLLCKKIFGLNPDNIKKESTKLIGDLKYISKTSSQIEILSKSNEEAVCEQAHVWKRYEINASYDKEKDLVEENEKFILKNNKKKPEKEFASLAEIMISDRESDIQEELDDVRNRINLLRSFESPQDIFKSRNVELIRSYLDFIKENCPEIYEEYKSADFYGSLYKKGCFEYEWDGVIYTYSTAEEAKEINNVILSKVEDEETYYYLTHEKDAPEGRKSLKLRKQVRQLANKVNENVSEYTAKQILGIGKSRAYCQQCLDKSLRHHDPSEEYDVTSSIARIQAAINRKHLGNDFLINFTKRHNAYSDFKIDPVRDKRFIKKFIHSCGFSSLAKNFSSVYHSADNIVYSLIYKEDRRNNIPYYKCDQEPYKSFVEWLDKYTFEENNTEREYEIFKLKMYGFTEKDFQHWANIWNEWGILPDFISENIWNSIKEYKDNCFEDFALEQLGIKKYDNNIFLIENVVMLSTMITLQQDYDKKDLVLVYDCIAGCKSSLIEQVYEETLEKFINRKNLDEFIQEYLEM